jgi:hypothetical protein
MVAVLFAATSGRVQIQGRSQLHQLLETRVGARRIAPPPLAGANVARECNVYFLGAQTAKILQVGRDQGGNEAPSQIYMLGRDGHPVDGVSVDWIMVLALIVYLVVMETRTGASPVAPGINLAPPNSCAGPFLRRLLPEYALPQLRPRDPVESRGGTFQCTVFYSLRRR